MQKLTPAMQQHARMKEKYPDCLLLFRMGDFYETFGEDAKIASKAMNITLTSRKAGLGGKTPLAGIPYHALDHYLKMLIQKGYKVAICEQVEDPKLAKGIVKREVVRVVTPGTIIEPEMLDRNTNNYLLSIVMDKKIFGLAYTDLSTGEFFTTQIEGKDSENRLISEIARIKPAECIIKNHENTKEKLFLLIKTHFEDLAIHLYDEEYFEKDFAYNNLIEHFGVHSLEGYGCENLNSAICASGAVLQYVKETQKNNLTFINSLKTYFPTEFMVLDSTTVRNLELIRNIRDNTSKNTVLSILDKTSTSMGSRLLKKWMLQPLIDVNEINKRLNAVEQIYNDIFLRKELIDLLKEINDIERIINRIVYGNANARELNALKDSLKIVPQIKKLINEKVRNNKGLLDEISNYLDNLDDIIKLIEESISDEPPVTITDGGLIKKNYNKDLDELRKVARGGKEWISKLENTEKEKTGIKSLKIRFNKVFGYYIEISKANLSLVPEDYIRKQTLVNAERFITPELKEKESLVLSADDKIKALEHKLFLEIREKTGSYACRVQTIAKYLSILDVLISFSEISVKNEYTKPKISDSDKIIVKEGRHPVVETTIPFFIANDINLDSNQNQLIIITGPNMSGKSTLMRQTAIISIMAQIGCFVPCRYASLGIVDRVFTRVGAFDDLVRGQSTFMVEMLEVANILHNATNKSLIILDEIGRGTSTFDGLSIAWAVAEKVNKIKAKAMFATHYHQLTQLGELKKGIKNYHIAAEDKNGNIVFLRKLIPGGTDKSYGIHVAKIAGIPKNVIKRADEILKKIEKDIHVDDKKEKSTYQKHTQLIFPTENIQMETENKKSEIETEIRELKIEKMTPLNALVKLEELKKKVIEKNGESNGN